MRKKFVGIFPMETPRSHLLCVLLDVELRVREVLLAVLELELMELVELLVAVPQEPNSKRGGLVVYVVYQSCSFLHFFTI